MIDVALREWAVVCELLSSGRMAVLLRKGGIHEEEGPGVFRLEHERFVLMPSYEHQRGEMLKEVHRRRLEQMREPDIITLDTLGEVARIWKVPGRRLFDKLDDLHCWSPAQIDMRFNYKPENPLYLVALRCKRLARPGTLANDWSYRGCKSWVQLRDHDAVHDTIDACVMNDDQFNAIVQRIDETLG